MNLKEGRSGEINKGAQEQRIDPRIELALAAFPVIEEQFRKQIEAEKKRKRKPGKYPLVLGKVEVNGDFYDAILVNVRNSRTTPEIHGDRDTSGVFNGNTDVLKVLSGPVTLETGRNMEGKIGLTKGDRIVPGEYVGEGIADSKKVALPAGAKAVLPTGLGHGFEGNGLLLFIKIPSMIPAVQAPRR